MHAAGVIHGDLKPENILLGGVGDPKIADFGLSGLSEAYATGVGPLVSGFTAAYAAPEQLQDAQRARPAADLYALGRMLFEMLTGRLPRGRESISEARPGSGRRLEQLLRELLDPNPRGRPGSADEVAKRLKEIAVDLDRMGLSVESRPEGAQVEIDGRAFGASPVSLPELPEGKHAIAVRAAGFHEHLEELELVPGRTLKLRVQLSPEACPHCSTKTASEGVVLHHESVCPKAPREAKPRQKPASAVRDAAKPEAGLVANVTEAGSESVGNAVLSILRWSERISTGTILKLCAAIVALQLAPRALAQWKLGLMPPAIVIAWVGLVCFGWIVNRRPPRLADYAGCSQVESSVHASGAKATARTSTSRFA